MRLCIYGAGAVGGHLAAKLAAAGHEVCVIARGGNLSAIRKNGIRLRHGDEEILGKVTAAQDPEGLLKKAVAPERIVGAVVYSSNEVVEPGLVVNHTAGNNMIVVGECDDRSSPAIARAHGVDSDGAPKRPSGGHSSGQTAHKPSILQDYERGRPMEIEAQLATPLAFARQAQVVTPTLDALIPLAMHKAAAKGLYTT